MKKQKVDFKILPWRVLSRRTPPNALVWGTPVRRAIPQGRILKSTFRFILSGVSLLTLTLYSNPLFARVGPSVGMMGMGNFFLTEGQPDLQLGPGGGLLFDYRFNQRWSVETDLFVTLHSGKNAFAGDKDIFLIGAPTFELKFYLRGQENNIDPYLLAGFGVYVLSEGTIDQNRGGVGVGGNFGLGVDFYLLERLSLGLAAKFRPIAVIQGNSQSTGLINFGMIGNLIWHFGSKS